MSATTRARASRQVGAAVGAIALLTAGIAALVAARDPGARERAVETPAVAGPGACVPSSEPAPPGPEQPAPPPASVPVPGAIEVDLGGLVVTDVVARDGAAWASVVDPAADPAAPGGRLARIDGASGAVVSTIPIVAGCSISALAVGERGVWVGTCNEQAASDADGGGLVVRVDPTTATVVRQAALPVACVDEITAAGGSVSASALPLVGDTTRIWRIDPSTGAVTETEQLTGETPGGIALTDDGLWVQERSSGGDAAVRSDPETGHEEVSVPEEGAVLVGSTDEAVWFQRSDAIVQRDAATGAVRTETPLDVQTAAVGASGAWYQQATPGSVTITIGRIEAATGAVNHTFQFEGVGLDRSGAPFPVRLAVDEAGVWVMYQGRVYRAIAPAAAASAPDSVPETSAPVPSTTPATTTSTTSPPATSAPPTTSVPTTTTPATT